MFEILNHTELAWLAAIHDAFSCAFMDAVMGFITATGNIGIIWIACAVLMLCFRKTRRTGITLAVALIFTVFLNNLTLKNLFARPRPFQVDPSIVLVIDPPGEFSFPSGHTLSSFAATTVIWHGLGKKHGIPALVWSCLIAFSRLYFRVHYVTDILGGMVIGTAVGALACLAVVKPVKQSHTVPPYRRLISPAKQARPVKSAVSSKSKVTPVWRAMRKRTVWPRRRWESEFPPGHNPGYQSGPEKQPPRG